MHWSLCYAHYIGRLFTDGSSDFQSKDETIYKEALSGIPGSWYEIVYPVQVRNGDVLSSIDTRDLKSKQKVSVLLNV